MQTGAVFSVWAKNVQDKIIIFKSPTLRFRGQVWLKINLHNIETTSDYWALYFSDISNYNPKSIKQSWPKCGLKFW